MPNIDVILRQISKDLVPQFEEKLRAYLADQRVLWVARIGTFNFVCLTMHFLRPDITWELRNYVEQLLGMA